MEYGRSIGEGVRPLHLEEALFEAMLAGWVSQQDARIWSRARSRRTRERFVRCSAC